MLTRPPSRAHFGDWRALLTYPGQPINWIGDKCSYCGSLHPSTLTAALIAKEVTGTWADWKYGWPHKMYFTGSITGKFYVTHLQDANELERDVIENYMRFRFVFTAAQITWTSLD